MARPRGLGLGAAPKAWGWAGEETKEEVGRRPIKTRISSGSGPKQATRKWFAKRGY